MCKKSNFREIGIHEKVEKFMRKPLEFKAIHFAHRFLSYVWYCFKEQ